MEDENPVQEEASIDSMPQSVYELGPQTAVSSNIFRSVESKVSGNEIAYSSAFWRSNDPPFPSQNTELTSPPHSLDCDIFALLFDAMSSTTDIAASEKIYSQLDQSNIFDSATANLAGTFEERDVLGYSSLSPGGSSNKSDVEVAQVSWCHDIEEAYMPDGVLPSRSSNQDEISTPSFDSSAVLDFLKESPSSDDDKQFDTSVSDGMDEADFDGKSAPSSNKSNASKNLVSERKRRKKLNERLYSLRAIVPKISKMDKASIVGDAIAYVRELQKQVAEMRSEVGIHGSKEVASEAGCGEHGREVVKPRTITSSSGCKELPEKKVTELTVSLMEKDTYHFQMHCKKDPGVLVLLTRALETMDVDILSANLASTSQHVLIMLVVKVKDGRKMTVESLKEMAVELLP